MYFEDPRDWVERETKKWSNDDRSTEMSSHGNRSKPIEDPGF